MARARFSSPTTPSSGSNASTRSTCWETESRGPRPAASGSIRAASSPSSTPRAAADPRAEPAGARAGGASRIRASGRAPCACSTPTRDIPPTRVWTTTRSAGRSRRRGPTVIAVSPRREARCGAACPAGAAMLRAHRHAGPRIADRSTSDALGRELPRRDGSASTARLGPHRQRYDFRGTSDPALADRTTPGDAAAGSRRSRFDELDRPERDSRRQTRRSRPTPTHRSRPQSPTRCDTRARERRELARRAGRARSTRTAADAVFSARRLPARSVRLRDPRERDARDDSTCAGASWRRQTGRTSAPGATATTRWARGRLQRRRTGYGDPLHVRRCWAGWSAATTAARRRAGPGMRANGLGRLARVAALPDGTARDESYDSARPPERHDDCA